MIVHGKNFTQFPSLKTVSDENFAQISISKYLSKLL